MRAAENVAADLRRIADLVESGLLVGHGFGVSFHTEDPARVQAITDALGGSVSRYRSHTGTIQASNRRTEVGSVEVSAIVLTDVRWDEDADDDMADAWTDLVGPAELPVEEVAA